MAEQLAHLTKLSGQPNIDIRVLPFSAGVLGELYGHFKIFEMGETYPDVADVETYTKNAYLEGNEAVQLAKLYSRLWSATLSRRKGHREQRWRRQLCRGCASLRRHRHPRL